MVYVSKSFGPGFACDHVTRFCRVVFEADVGTTKGTGFDAVPRSMQRTLTVVSGRVRPPSIGVWQRVAMDSLRFHPGPPCPTFLCPADGPPPKRPYSCFGRVPPAALVTCGRLLPFWTPHAVRLCLRPNRRLFFDDDHEGRQNHNEYDPHIPSYEQHRWSPQFCFHFSWSCIAGAMGAYLSYLTWLAHPDSVTDFVKLFVCLNIHPTPLPLVAPIVQSKCSFNLEPIVTKAFMSFFGGYLCLECTLQNPRESPHPNGSYGLF
jgi:hypothetical protein